MGIRSSSMYRVVDAEGGEHWVPIQKAPRPPRSGSLFWRGVGVLVLLLAGGGWIASSLPVSQSGGVVGSDYTVRTLAPTSTVTTIPVTTKASGPAAVACRALGFD